MPRNSSEESVEARSEAHPEPTWCGIGINAVAAASMCKSSDRHERDAEPRCFPFAETEYATD